jgi:hypothetical protein
MLCPSIQTDKYAYRFMRGFRFVRNRAPQSDVVILSDDARLRAGAEELI